MNDTGFTYDLDLEEIAALNQRELLVNEIAKDFIIFLEDFNVLGEFCSKYKTEVRGDTVALNLHSNPLTWLVVFAEKCESNDEYDFWKDLSFIWQEFIKSIYQDNLT